MLDVYIILTCIVLFIVYQYRYFLIKIEWISLCKSIWFILPIITMYLDKNTISKIINNTNQHKSKRILNQTTKKVVAANQKWNCKMCNNILDASYEVDHINPLYNGGTNDISNLQALCRNCHGKKTIYDKLNI
jgi:5-methylcytosine-specific restriction enzyme A